MTQRDLSIREISDRIHIHDLLIRYTRAIDTKDWALLDTCFTPDAHLDYTATGGTAGAYPEVRAWLEKALAPFPITVHYITNSAVELDGDPRRLDLPDRHCQLAREIGVPVALVSRASRPEELERMRYAVDHARRGWLEAGDTLNARPLAELRKALR